MQEYLSITRNHLWFPQAQLQTNATESSEAEIALHTEVRGLRSELDEAKRKASRLSQEHRELTLHLEASEKDKEALKQTVKELEESKRQQERAVERLNKEVRSRDPIYSFTNKSFCSLEHPTADLRIHSTQKNHPLCFFPLSTLVSSVSMSL